MKREREREREREGGRERDEEKWRTKVVNNIFNTTEYDKESRRFCLFSQEYFSN